MVPRRPQDSPKTAPRWTSYPDPFLDQFLVPFGDHFGTIFWSFWGRFLDHFWKLYTSGQRGCLGQLHRTPMPPRSLLRPILGPLGPPPGRQNPENFRANWRSPFPLREPFLGPFWNDLGPILGPLKIANKLPGGVQEHENRSKRDLFSTEKRTLIRAIRATFRPAAGGPRTPVKTEGKWRFACIRNMNFHQILMTFWPFWSDILGPLGGVILRNKLLFWSSERGSKTRRKSRYLGKSSEQPWTRFWADLGPSRGRRSTVKQREF